MLFIILLLYGITKEEEIKGYKKFILGKTYKCITKSYFGVFDYEFFVDNIMVDDKI